MHLITQSCTASYCTNAHIDTINTINIVVIAAHDLFTVYVPLQNKCEQYWHDQVDKPFDAGRDFTVVTTAYRGFADYDVRDMTVQCVS